jgi:hypothetical protein
VRRNWLYVQRSLPDWGVSIPGFQASLHSVLFYQAKHLVSVFASLVYRWNRWIPHHEFNIYWAKDVLASWTSSVSFSLWSAILCSCHMLCVTKVGLSFFVCAAKEQASYSLPVDFLKRSRYPGHQISRALPTVVLPTAMFSRNVIPAVCEGSLFAFLLHPCCISSLLI